MADFTTMEKLQVQQSAQFGATVRFGDKVLHTDMSCLHGFYCTVYEFVDDPDEVDEIEARLNMVAERLGFEDGGHALKWGLTR